MDVAALFYLGCALPDARKRIPIMLDTQVETVIEELSPYSCGSCKELDSKLKTDGICLYGHTELLSVAITALSTDSNPFLRSTAVCFLGCDLQIAEKKIPLFHEEEKEAVKGSLAQFFCGTYGELKEKLKEAGTVVFGEGDLLGALVSDLTVKKTVSNEHNVIIFGEVRKDQTVLFDKIKGHADKPKSEFQEMLSMIESGTDTEKLAEMVSSAKADKRYPSKEEMTRLFEAAFVASTKQVGETAVLYDQICRDLKEMLYAVHRKVSLVR